MLGSCLSLLAAANAVNSTDRENSRIRKFRIYSRGLGSVSPPSVAELAPCEYAKEPSGSSPGHVKGNGHCALS